MPFGRPPVDRKRPDHMFKVIKAIKVSEGQFNEGVYQVQHRSTGEICIEKRLKTSEIREGRAQKEIILLRSIKHRNVSDYIHAFCTGRESHDPQASIFMDFCDLGSLNDVLENHAKHHKGIGEGFVWSAFKQLTNAIGYIQYGIEDTVQGGHRDYKWRMILHRDIYPRNIMLKKRHDGSPYPRVILGDFGVSVVVESEGMAPGHYNGRDPYWAVPEAPNFGPPSDIWCLGAVIQDMVRLDGPASRYGRAIAQGRHFQGKVNIFSDQLNEALYNVMNDNWRVRSKIRVIGPKLAILEQKAKVGVYNMPEWSYDKHH